MVCSKVSMYVVQVSLRRHVTCLRQSWVGRHREIRAWMHIVRWGRGRMGMMPIGHAPQVEVAGELYLPLVLVSKICEIVSSEEPRTEYRLGLCSLRKVYPASSCLGTEGQFMMRSSACVRRRRGGPPTAPPALARLGRCQDKTAALTRAIAKLDRVDRVRHPNYVTVGGI